MASGRLASLDITNAATDTQLYACPNNKTASFSISVVNRSNSNNALIRIALTNGTSITNDSYVAYDVTLYPNEVYERSGFVLSQGQFVYVRSSVTSVNAVVYGYEE
jgi:hypothetical protein